MPDPLHDRGRLADALHLIELEAVEYLESVDGELGAKLLRSSSRAPAR